MLVVKYSASGTEGLRAKIDYFFYFNSLILFNFYLNRVFESEVKVEEVFAGGVPGGDLEQDLSQLLFVQVHENIGERGELADHIARALLHAPFD